MATTINLSNKKRIAPLRRRTNKRAIAPQTRAVRARPMNRKNKVTSALLQEMTRRLVKEFDPEQIILFGSYAWGTPNKDSDVDLMVIVAESEETEYQRMVRALRVLREMTVPSDVFVKTRAEFDRYKHVYASLECLITEKGQVLYERRSKTGTRTKVVPQSAT